MNKLKTLCLVDESFQKVFADWKKFTKEIVDYSNKYLKKVNIQLTPKIKKWKTKQIKKTYNEHLKNISKYSKKYHLVIGFTNKAHFFDYPFYCGINQGKLLIVGKFFPIKIPLLYRYGLKKLTLHELGHSFGLKDSLFTNFSIMDNFLGIFTSRFNKKQRKTIKKFSK